MVTGLENWFNNTEVRQHTVHYYQERVFVCGEQFQGHLFDKLMTIHEKSCSNEHTTGELIQLCITLRQSGRFYMVPLRSQYNELLYPSCHTQNVVLRMTRYLFLLR